MELVYNIELLSDWHISSGLDAGTSAQILVLKDENNLPVIPGKSIKGLVRNAMEDMLEVEQCTEAQITKIFGKTIKAQSSIPGKAFFSTATLPCLTQQEVINHRLAPQLYRNIASTAIGEKGIALKGSLRVMQVCLPVTLQGEITGVEAVDLPILKKAFNLIRQLGAHRNRGLGRCSCSVEQKKEA